MFYLVSNQLASYHPKGYEYISLKDALRLLEQEEELGLDSETTGLDCYTKKLLLFQLGTDKFQIVFDIESYGYKLPKELKEFLNKFPGIFIIQNAKFDLKFLFMQEVIIRSVYDTMLAETILTNGLQYSGRDLKSIVEKYCGVTLNKEIRGQIISKGINDAVLFYAAADVEHLKTIKRKQLAEAKSVNLLNAIALDNSFVIVLAYVEFCGIKLDIKKWLIRAQKNKKKAFDLKLILEQKLWEDGKFRYFSGMQDMYTGKQDCTLNWDSPKQVIALFKEYGINTTLKVKGVDKETIDAKILEPQKNKFPILAPYLDYKGMQKEVSTYGDNWKNYINTVTGRIHTTFKQLMDTGRLSCGNKDDKTPNLQNLPSDKETRSCFISESFCSLTSADYSSQEQIVLANFSQESNLLNFYKKGFKDMHSYVTFLMYPDIRRCSIEDLVPESLYYIPNEYSDKRKLAKNAGFAINYGGNGSTIAKNCGIPKKDGDFVYNKYFEVFPDLKEYFDLVFERASRFGYIEFNKVTRRKYFFDPIENDYFKYRDIVTLPNFWQEYSDAKEIFKKYNFAKSVIARLAQNYPIQGSSSDITKYACILFFKIILERGWFMKVKIVNLVHDEIVIETPIELQEEAKSALISCMKKAGEPFCPIVPLGATADTGDHWIH